MIGCKIFYVNNDLNEFFLIRKTIWLTGIVLKFKKEEEEAIIVT